MSGWWRGRAVSVGVLLGTLAGCQRGGPSLPAPGAELHFLVDGQLRRRVTATELVALAAPHEAVTDDPYYGKRKRFWAVPLAPVLAAIFSPGELQGVPLILRARDGYTVPIDAGQLSSGGAQIALADLDKPGWEPIGPQQANPAPFYLFWTSASERNLDTHPRPWQLTSIERVPLAQVFPLAHPVGLAPDDPAMRGFGLFASLCIRCHAINQQGGHVGPDLNVPQSIVAYRPAAQIRAYIRDPATFRYGNMPAHPQLRDLDLDWLLAYFEHMSKHQHEGKKPSP